MLGKKKHQILCLLINVMFEHEKEKSIYRAWEGSGRLVLAVAPGNLTRFLSLSSVTIATLSFSTAVFSHYVFSISASRWLPLGAQIDLPPTEVA